MFVLALKFKLTSCLFYALFWLSTVSYCIILLCIHFLMNSFWIELIDGYGIVDLFISFLIMKPCTIFKIYFRSIKVTGVINRNHWSDVNKPPIIGCLTSVVIFPSIKTCKLINWRWMIDFSWGKTCSALCLLCFLYLNMFKVRHMCSFVFKGIRLFTK